ncbi:hypothetical protein EJ06DRAFT_534844 [Trichodelitschia bisporula]|uniref:Uncharacterized protein n=1 Tax=Trichodelitschia bisporula TaxID=703511 RepID=A0A6G1HHV5_9PEZI|nr:hypothetical protein EJ06DRAFT_534844 [Trichodelitschia bisporula]
MRWPWERNDGPEPRPTKEAIPAIEHKRASTISRKSLRPQSRTISSDAAFEAAKVKHVARCAGLLRQMYALDIMIWGMENCVDAERPRREELKFQANALLKEVTVTVEGWRSMPVGYWSVEEQEVVDGISRTIAGYDKIRYHAS